ncbi:hypothetical protein D3C80_1278630 [compost metagenome]
MADRSAGGSLWPQAAVAGGLCDFLCDLPGGLLGSRHRTVQPAAPVAGHRPGLCGDGQLPGLERGLQRSRRGADDGATGQYRTAFATARAAGWHFVAGVGVVALAVRDLRRLRSAVVAGAVPLHAGDAGRRAPRWFAPGVPADPPQIIVGRLCAIARQPPVCGGKRGPRPGRPAIDRLDRAVAGAAYSR